MDRRKYITCPQTNEKNMKMVLFTIAKSPLALQYKELENLSGIKGNQLMSAFSLLRELKYVKSYGYRRRFKKLTDDGKRLVKLLEDNDREKLKEFTESHINKSKILTVALSGFKGKANLSQIKLGKYIAKEIDANWDTSATYRMVARSCRDALHMLGQIEYTPQKEIIKRKKDVKIDNGMIWYHFAKIFANQNTWHTDIVSMNRIKAIIKNMRNRESNGFHWIIESVDRNIELGFKKKDIDHIREGLKLYLDYLEKHKTKENKNNKT